MTKSLIQTTFPKCPECNKRDKVTTNKLFDNLDPKRYFCKRCKIFFDR